VEEEDKREWNGKEREEKGWGRTAPTLTQIPGSAPGICVVLFSLQYFSSGLYIFMCVLIQPLDATRNKLLISKGGLDCLAAWLSDTRQAKERWNRGRGF